MKVSRGSAIRRGFGISAYIGLNGGGKTFAAVSDCLPSLAYGRPVLSTVRLLDWTRPGVYCWGCDWPQALDEQGNHLDADHFVAHPMAIPFVSFDQLLEARNLDVLMDEVQGVASSRESGALPFQVANRLHKLRAIDVMLRYTGVSWARADKTIREATQSVTYCAGFMPKARPAGEDEAPRMWRDKRLLWWRTYDARAFEVASGSRDGAGPSGQGNFDLRPIVSERCWRPRSEVQFAYDTLGGVTSLGWASEAGMCLTCGGRRRVPTCSCDDHTGRSAPRKRSEESAQALVSVGAGGPAVESARRLVGVASSVHA